MAATEMSADDAVALVRSHDAVGLGLITGTPTALMKALSRRDDWEDLTFSGGLIGGHYDVFLHPNAHYRSSFCGGCGAPSEMFTDGLYQLIAAGKVTNRKKNIHRGTSVITFAAGTQEMYDFIDDNPAIGVAPVTYTNNPHVIAQNYHVVSINSAREVDLHGQIIADTLGARQYSGSGGHQDFVEGTSLSLEHTSLIGLTSTALVNEARKSRVVSTITPHSVVTSPRHLAGVIVTEHGAADLRGKTVRERARAMMEIAEPEFRGELAAGADLLGR